VTKTGALANLIAFLLNGHYPVAREELLSRLGSGAQFRPPLAKRVSQNSPLLPQKHPG